MLLELILLRVLDIVVVGDVSLQKTKNAADELLLLLLLNWSHNRITSDSPGSPNASKMFQGSLGPAKRVLGLEKFTKSNLIQKVKTITEESKNVEEGILSNQKRN